MSNFSKTLKSLPYVRKARKLKLSIAQKHELTVSGHRHHPREMQDLVFACNSNRSIFTDPYYLRRTDVVMSQHDDRGVQMPLINALEFAEMFELKNLSYLFGDLKLEDCESYADLERLYNAQLIHLLNEDEPQKAKLKLDAIVDKMFTDHLEDALRRAFYNEYEYILFHRDGNFLEMRSKTAEGLVVIPRFERDAEHTHFLPLRLSAEMIKRYSLSSADSDFYAFDTSQLSRNYFERFTGIFVETAEPAEAFSTIEGMVEVHRNSNSVGGRIPHRDAFLADAVSSYEALTP